MNKELKSARSSAKEIEKYAKYSQCTFYKSQIPFLNEHKGYRPKCMHLVLGMPSGGKSTLLRTMLFDLSRNGLGIDTEKETEKCLLWLSEESREQFLTELNQSVIHGSNDWVCLDRINIISEMDGDITFDPRKLNEDWCCQMYDYILENHIRVLFLDNITTSKIYSGKTPAEQEEVASRLKKMASATGVAIVIFAHTKSSVRGGNGIIDINDVRGNATIVNISEFQYICQKFDINKEIYNTLRIVKNRGQDVKNPLFFLPYDSRSRTYVNINPLEFLKFKELFNQRNRL